MTKEEQIEEMAKYVGTACENYVTVGNIQICEYKDGLRCNKCSTALYGATRLHESGYRKADEVRKETAREITEKLKSKLRDRVDGTTVDGAIEANRAMKEIAAEYGVEVEE